MNYNVYNNSSMDLDFEDKIHDLLGFAQNRFGLKRVPEVHLDSNLDNASNHLGKTGYYNPETLEIHIFIDGRHAKDIMRSIAHEMVHHWQNEQGSLANSGYTGEGYAQKNPHLRKMEREAYEKGNMCFRDWEDSYKSTNYRQRSDTMSLKEWKNKELSGLLSERWGFKMNLNEMGMGMGAGAMDPMGGMSGEEMYPEEPMSPEEMAIQDCIKEKEMQGMSPCEAGPACEEEMSMGQPEMPMEQPPEHIPFQESKRLEEKIYKAILSALKGK
tara:strand:- start:443 stop:1255 length:813 start_codon:yes stop_codon:yes gene_type:complete